jgi:hypothetical protein
MEVDQDPNWGCSAKKMTFCDVSIWKTKKVMIDVKIKVNIRETGCKDGC